MRCAIYARFSSDLQDARSITDQVTLARQYAGARGLTVVSVIEDARISGAAVVNRPGIQKLMSDAAAQKFDVVVTESLDRLSRSQADIAALYERLTFWGIQIETLADGQVSEIHVGLKGTMAALFLKDLAQKTRRGQIGRVKAGRIPGGRSYGYDVVHAENDRGQRVINQKEASIVRRIYEEYASGRGTLPIVKDLNREGHPGPTGRAWNLSAVVGSPKRGNGILNNELYRGVIVYNRQQFLKDPATGKRVSRVNPRSAWLRQEVPDLRIIEEGLWLKVQTIRESRGGPMIHLKRGPQRLLSGLVHCGCCGARYNIATKDHMRCSAQTNSGTCVDSRIIRMSEIESRVLSAVSSHLLSDEMVEAAVDAYRQELARLQSNQKISRGQFEIEIGEVERKFARLMRMVEDGHVDPGVAGPRLNELAAKKRSLSLELAREPICAPEVPSTDERQKYRLIVDNLRCGKIEGLADEREAFDLVRGLVRRIVVTPNKARHHQALEVTAGIDVAALQAAPDCNYGCGGWI
ncbi:recombinase family protein [Hyphomicrobium sp.]|uniref:recombinase family protein n=1 Tax=Hyphomicrobium sp. TaxID=82 RepID=UPI00356ACAD1